MDEQLYSGSLEKSPPSNELFRAFKEGNNYFPQTHVGEKIAIGVTLLKNPLVNFREFSRTELSNEQADIVGKLMTNIHRKNEIEAARTQEARAGEKPIPNERIKVLWKDFRDDTLAHLAASYEAVTGRHPENGGLVDYLQSIHTDITVQDQRKQLIQFFDISYGLLHSPQGQELQDKHKQDITQRHAKGLIGKGSHRPPNMQYVTEFQKLVREEAAKQISPALTETQLYSLSGKLY